MPHIESIKRKRGTAHRVHWSVNGVPHSEYFPAQIPAHLVKAFARNVLSDEYQERYHLKSTLSLADLDRTFCFDRREEIQTWRHRIAMRHLIAFLSPDIPAAEVSPQQIHAFRDELLRSRLKSDDFAAEQKTKRGVNNDLRNIRVVFRWAFRQEMIERHPFDRVQLFKVAPPRPDILTPEEMHAIRMQLPKRDRLIFHFLRFTGLRIGEAIEVRCEDVDLEQRRIHLHKTKNRQSLDIPIDERLARIWRWTKVLEAGEYVIPYRGKMTVIHKFRAAMNRAGVYKKMPTHIFRHTAGRRIMERYFTTGNAQEIARKFLRHKSRVMTDHYAQIFAEDIGKAMNDVNL